MPSVGTLGELQFRAVGPGTQGRLQLQERVDLVANSCWHGGANMQLRCGHVCAERVMRGQFVEREMFSMFVGGMLGVTMATKRLGCFLTLKLAYTLKYSHGN